MKVSKSRIEKLIQESIREIYGLEDELLSERTVFSKDIIQKMADVCMSKKMNPSSMFGMCAQICEANEENSMNCCKLCEYILSGDSAGCTQCLVKICKCPSCLEICKTCCGC